MRDEQAALIDYRIEKANQTLKAAEKLYEENFYNSSINRSYYACYYVVNAALYLKGFSSSKHSGVIHLFNLHFIKNKVIDKSFGKFFSNLFRLRQESDYEDYKEFSSDEAKEYLDGSRIFIFELTKFIKNNIK